MPLRPQKNDEYYTPAYAVVPLIKYLKSKNIRVVWCPFDTEWSYFYKVLTAADFIVECSHIQNEQDFLTYEPRIEYDAIVSNPPFSIKDQVIARCYELGKPFALLMSVPTLQGGYRFKYFKTGLELLVFDKRIYFFDDQKAYRSNWFASAYFCHGLLPQSLVFEEIKRNEDNEYVIDSMC